MFKSFLSMKFFWLLAAAFMATLGLGLGKVTVGPGVNTQYKEVAPVLTHDNSGLYFSRQGSPQNFGSKLRHDDQDIWFSRRNGTNEFGKAVHLGRHFNSELYDYPIGSSVDGHTIYFCCSRGLISFSRYHDGRWALPQEMTIAGFQNKSDYAAFSVGSDELTLVMAVHGDDSIGREDLYISTRDELSTWTGPAHLGAVINTVADETTPFLANDGETLYFASDRPGGRGGYDIYMSRRVANSRRKWTRPRNLGHKINGLGNDFYFTLTPAGTTALLVNKGDIVRANLPIWARPGRTLKVIGRVVSPSGEARAARISYSSKKFPNRRGMANTRDDGAFTLRLAANQDWILTASSKRRASLPYKLSLGKNVGEGQVKLVIWAMAKGGRLVLNDVLFPSGSAKMRRGTGKELRQLARLLIENSDLLIEVAGHTDKRGSQKANQQLSRRRAQTVRAFLLKLGVPRRQVSARGYGESKTRSTSNSLNRRVEFRVVAP